MTSLFSAIRSSVYCFVILCAAVACTTQTDTSLLDNDARIENVQATELASQVMPTANALPAEPPTLTAMPLMEPSTPTSQPTVTSTSTPKSTATPTATSTPTVTPSPEVPPPAWDLLPWIWDGRNYVPDQEPPLLGPLPGLALAPGAPTGYLDKFRLIAFYGSPEGPGLGILGNQSWRASLRIMRAIIADYRAVLNDNRYMIPTYHAIATAAKPCTSVALCRLHVNEGMLWELATFARNNNAAVVLDIQPGRANIQDEFNRLRDFLYEPHVHLALDPEFRVNEEQQPNVNLGSVDAADINWIQAQMNQIAIELGVNRVLIIHQFTDGMITNKQDILNHPHVELVIDGDGYGPWGPKIGNYLKYANEPGFEYGGFKMFTDSVDGRLLYDVPFMLPKDVVRELEPDPVVIIYQ